MTVFSAIASAIKMSICSPADMVCGGMVNMLIPGAGFFIVFNDNAVLVYSDGAALVYGVE